MVAFRVSRNAICQDAYTMIIDDVKITVIAGHGGRGMAVFSKTKKTLGPTGGSGGNGNGLRDDRATGTSGLRVAGTDGTGAKGEEKQPSKGNAPAVVAGQDQAGGAPGIDVQGGPDDRD